MNALQRISDLRKPLKDERLGHKNHHELARQSEAKLKQAPESEENVCRRRRTKMKSQKNLPYWLHRSANNAQNTQHKLGVAFEVWERNYGHCLIE